MTHRMTGPEYNAALHILNLTPEQAATWLGIGRSTAYRYLKTGCEGPVVMAIRERIERMADIARLRRLQRWDVSYTADGEISDIVKDDVGDLVMHSDLTAAVGVGS